jgi:hypothetical protein
VPSTAGSHSSIRNSPSVSFDGAALIHSRISRREFGYGDLFLTREEADSALGDVLRDRAAA